MLTPAPSSWPAKHRNGNLSAESEIEFSGGNFSEVLNTEDETPVQRRSRTSYINAILIQSRKLPPLASCDKCAFDAEMLAMGDPSWSAESSRATSVVRVATESGQIMQFGAPYETGRAPSAPIISASICRIRRDQIYHPCPQPSHGQISSLLLFSSSSSSVSVSTPL